MLWNEWKKYVICVAHKSFSEYYEPIRKRFGIYSQCISCRKVYKWKNYQNKGKYEEVIQIF